MSLKSMLSDIITTTSGAAVDIARIMGLVGFATYLGLAVYDVVWRQHEFHMQDFGIGLGTVVAATAAAIKLNTDNG